MSVMEDVAHRLLTRTAPNSVVPATVRIPDASIQPSDYQVWYILDTAVADELRRVLATAPVGIRQVAEFFLRPHSQSPYDARFGPGPLDYSPVVARTTVHARQILSARASYLKAYVIYTRGVLNSAPCTNNCAAAVRGDKPFTAFAGCISIAGEWGGACSNCVWQEHGASCRPGAAPGAGGAPSRTSAIGANRAIAGPSFDEEELVDAE